jgi:hypothetical protein
LASGSVPALTIPVPVNDRTAKTSAGVRAFLYSLTSENQPKCALLQVAWPIMTSVNNPSNTSIEEVADEAGVHVADAQFKYTVKDLPRTTTQKWTQFLT